MNHDGQSDDHRPALNKVYQGDCLATMTCWPDSFVDSTITSPPYFALRSYLPDDHKDKSLEFGCDCSLDDYLNDMADVFRQVYRITKPSGSLWVVIGESWAGPKNKRYLSGGLESGEMIGIPHRLRESIRGTGWRSISECIWFKPNSNSHYAGHRPNCSHEYIFQFSKTDKPYYDSYAIMEPSKYQEDPDRTLMTHARSVWTIPTVSMNGRKLMADFKLHDKYLERNPECPMHGDNPSDFSDLDLFRNPMFRDPDAALVLCRCTEIEEDFFAAMPPKLAEKCILCSTSARGNCTECGAPFERVVSKDRVATRPGTDVKVDSSGHARKDPKRHVTYIDQVGWRPTCKCWENSTCETSTPAIVFDPFAGSGSVLMAAEMTGRNWIGCELNEILCSKLIPARLKSLYKKAR